jgi:hypothetical protein
MFSFVDGQSDVSQSVVSVGPQAHFRYNFSKQTRLEFRYNGNTSQPQFSQLQTVPNNSFPSNLWIGNPNLKSEFRHRINSQFNHFSEEKQSNIFSSLSFDITQNKIANVTIFNHDLFPNIPLDSAIFRPGGRINTFQNVDWDYSGWGSMSYGMPLFSKKVNAHTSTGGSIRNSKSIIDEDVNVMNSFRIGQDLRIMYREERFHVSLYGHISTSNTKYSLQSNLNNVSNDRSAGGDFSWQVIKGKLTLSSDIRYETRTGLFAGFYPTSTVWNAQLSYNIGKTNDAQVLFRVVDILNDRRDTFRHTSENSIRDITYKNTLRRFFMVSFIYNKRQTSPGR